MGQKVCVRERERARAEKSTNGRVVMRMTVESKDKWTSLSFYAPSVLVRGSGNRCRSFRFTPPNVPHAHA